MSNFDVPTGDPPPRRRYRIGYRFRAHNTDEPWIVGEMEVISRSPEEAEEFAGSIMEPERFECEFSACTDVTEEEV
jgi:hypothetical protein